MDEDLVRVVDGEEEGGMEASTKWKCLSASVSAGHDRRASQGSRSFYSASQASHSLLSLLPATGRKHQLRVHCAEVLKGAYMLEQEDGRSLTLPSHRSSPRWRLQVRSNSRSSQPIRHLIPTRLSSSALAKCKVPRTCPPH